jgi:hypothetical protein
MDFLNVILLSSYKRHIDFEPFQERLREKIITKLTEGGSNADEPVNIPLTDYSRYISYSAMYHHSIKSDMIFSLILRKTYFSLSHSESEQENSADDDGKNADTIITMSKKSRIPKKRYKPTLIVKDNVSRPSLTLSKTSVDVIRISQNFQKQTEQSDVNVAVTRELALFKRLTKFRRKPQWPNKALAANSPITDRDSSSTKIAPKCNDPILCSYILLFSCNII